MIAVAGGRAFTFAYAETTELLRAAGCDPVVFDPATDEALPPGTRGLYLGGGFPELHAADLSGNDALRTQLRSAIADGLPTVAECAGLLYLCDTVDGAEMVGAIPVEAAMAPRLTLAYRTAVAPSQNLLSSPGSPAWSFAPDHIDGVATQALHASYLHTHWAGHPQLAARFAAAVHAAEPVALPPRSSPSRSSPSRSSPSRSSPSRSSSLPRCRDLVTEVPTDPLRHHGDVEATPGLADFAVNVYDGPRPDWLEAALLAADPGRYPDATPARAAIAVRHRRSPDTVLPTAGAAEAFGLIARLRSWRCPVVVHPQFTEPDVALTGHPVRHVTLDAATGFQLDASVVPADADLVVIGNPTNPTGVRHPASTLLGLLAGGRVVVVDEAFLEDGAESLADTVRPGLLVIRSLTKLWTIPGIRAGYMTGDADTVAALARLQTPWSVSAAAVAALVACTSDDAIDEAGRRVARIARDREYLSGELARLGIEHVGSTAPFVLARPGAGVHNALRQAGFAVRRADTFPGLDETWVRIAVRDREPTAALVAALATLRSAR